MREIFINQIEENYQKEMQTLNSLLKDNKISIQWYLKLSELASNLSLDTIRFIKTCYDISLNAV